MSEDRTQEPSKRRLLEARARGQVARSPELTGAMGLLAASALLGVWGDDLILGLIGLARGCWSGDLGVSSGSVEVVERLRRAALDVAGPLCGILGGTVVALVVAHQAQVGGLLAPSLLAPDFSRLWGLKLDDEEGSGSGLAGRVVRGFWSLAKATVIVAMSAWAIRSNLEDLHRLGRLEPLAMARASGSMIRSTALTMAWATMVLGLIDFALQRQRFSALMRLTPDEHREDLKSADGDPALRGRRRRLAQAMRGDAPEILAGASLAVVGASGLVVILTGGPPPRRVLVRSSANGSTGRSMIRSVDSANLARLDSPSMAMALARLRSPLVPPELLAELASNWPVDE